MQKMKKLTKEQLIELVAKIYSCECDTEEERSKLRQTFEANVPYQDVWQLFHQNADSTPEEIVEKALAHKPVIIELGGPIYSKNDDNNKDKKGSK